MQDFLRFSAQQSPKKFWMAFAALLALALASVSIHAQDDPPDQAGRLSYVTGNVSVQPAGTQDWGQAYPNLPIGPGDRLYTDDSGMAEIQIGRSYLRIGPDSDVTLTTVAPDRYVVAIGQGSVHVRSFGFWQGQTLYIQSPNGSLAVNQPAEFRVDTIPSDDATVYTAYAGAPYVYSYPDLQVPVQAGQALELFGSNPVATQWLEPAGFDNLDNWSRSRDAAIANAASYQYVSPAVSGAWELDANGQWMGNSPYGPIWFPRVQAGWAPYRNGHWINRAPWGWTWVEDEQWGYAPFHYGRWVQYGGRWGWVAGPPAQRPVWSPALVAFAGGISVGGGGVSAWFPLGPGEAYRPWYPCSPRYIDAVNIANIRPAPRVVVQKTYVNIVNVNVTNITYVNRTVGVTAVRQADFAAGRPVARSVVAVNPQMMARARVIARPAVAPTAAAKMGPPPRQPVRAPAARPVVMNEKGQMVAAAPHARPAPPPARPAPQVRPPAGRRPTAPPPGAKVKNSAPVRPGQQVPARPTQQAPANRPQPPVQQQRPQPVQPARPEQQRPALVPAPARPAPARPEQTTRPATPEQRPQPAVRPEQQQRPEQRPGQVAPEQQRPAERPAPQRPETQRPETQRPGAQPAVRPSEKPAAKPNPKNEKNRRPEEQKPEEKPQPQPQAL